MVTLFVEGFITVLAAQVKALLLLWQEWEGEWRTPFSPVDLHLFV